MDSISFIPDNQRLSRDLVSKSNGLSYTKIIILALSLVLIQIIVFQSAISIIITPQKQQLQSQIDQLNIDLPADIRDMNQLRSALWSTSIISNQLKKSGETLTQIVPNTIDSVKVQKISYSKTTNIITLTVEVSSVEVLNQQVEQYRSLELVSDAVYTEFEAQQGAGGNTTNIQLFLN